MQVQRKADGHVRHHLKNVAELLGRVAEYHQFERLVLAEAGHHGIGAHDVDVGQGVAGRPHTGDVDGLDRADMAQDGVQLAGEAVEFIIAQRQAGQSGQVGHLVSGDL